MDAVIRSIDGSAIDTQLYIDWGAAILLSVIYFVLTWYFFGVVEKRVRVSGNLARG